MYKQLLATLNIVSKIDNGHTWSHIPDKNGIIINNSAQRKKDRKRARKNKEKKITQEEYNECLEKLRLLTKLSDTINKNVKTKCWLFQNHLVNDYGMIRLNGVRFMSHIFAHESKNGKHDLTITPVIRHLCNNKECCNPEHLVSGTHSQNTIDAVKNGSKQAKLNEDKIREIRDDLKKNITQKEIAKKYNIDNSQISRINTGKTWNHVL